MSDDRPEPTGAVYEICDLAFRYPDAIALDGLTMSIRRGERVAVLGANGSGKSTLLRLLDGLELPLRGTILFDGEPLSEARLRDDALAAAFRRRVGFVFQNPDVQLFNPTVFDEVAFAPLQLGWSHDEVRRRVGTVLDALRLSHLRDRSPHRLSGGEKKRVSLASVLVYEPDVLLLDEPTAGLDPRSQSQIIDQIVEWGGTKTIVTATHDLDVVEDIADRCCVIEDGRLAAEGAPAAILGDLELLQRTSLVHAHRHAHAPGELHAHPHRHRGHHHH